MFAPEHRVPEDPAAGSSSGRVHDATRSRFERRRYTLGQRTGRQDGAPKLFARCDSRQHGVDGIEVGGYVTPLVEATMTI
jgi:predicted PhzF superfamily epimerase YddE/YHI9